MTIDAFTFLGESLLGYPQSEGELLARLDAAGVEQAVVCPLKPPGYHLEAANDRVAEACRQQSRFVGIARVDPNQGVAPCASWNARCGTCGCVDCSFIPGRSRFG